MEILWKRTVSSEFRTVWTIQSVSTKLTHQENRWNFGILRSGGIYIYIWFYEWYFLLKRSTFFIKCYALFVTCCRSCAHYSIWCTYHVMCNFLLHLQSLLSDSIMCFDLYITVIPLTSTPSAYLISKRCAF